ncbi:hypothetical protein [Bacteroides pyogenes]|uniref:LPD3 domain-containing protein n=1 Tax=Bacteroides pyogenes TaxID=310300 RepID=UPI0031FF417A|nr:hypothetical protein [Bacteroides pyogenes]MBR8739819.1 hypothetical protein [Bacteroides pyogenes]MBR8755618.1 hypothetical protein [Bacteroides pyogenes]MBR8796917.1 hypothetical protein [Bacteroides pyogenes]MBR8810522.1 hypothetical protein [Bacteroides pyogenes]
MEDLYYNDSCPSCAAFRGEATQGFTFDKEVLKQALKTIYKQDFSPTADIEEHLFDETFATFGRAIDEGYGKPAPGASNEGFYHELRRNAAVFSAFKVHRLQNDIAAQLVDGNGQLKPFERFAEDVRPMLDHQVERWLRTEYDTAVIRAHQAADWRKYMEQAHILPNLRWLPTTSATPDIVHKQFWSIELTLPVGHPFWNAHRPGDRWNCHCSLEATDDAPTPGHEIPKTTPQNKPAPGLDNNPGTDAKLFSDTHPYVAHAYKGAKKAVEKFIKEKFPDKASVKVDPKHDEPKSYAARTKEIKKAAAPLKEEIFVNKRFKKDIRITGRGIKEWLNQPHEHYAHKNELLLRMGDVMKKAKYMGYGKDKHDPSVKAHLFEVKILGDKSWIIVRELKPGRVEIYSISDSPRILDIIEKPTS